MIIKILPRYLAADLFNHYGEELFERINVISINDPEGKPLFGLKHRPRLLSLSFHDIPGKIEGFINFNEEHAEQIINFLNCWYKTTSSTPKLGLLIHCTAGVCRSGAVGEFAREYLGLDYDEFIKDNPHICPNALVSKTLREVYSRWS